MALSPLNQRRWRNFKANRRALWSLVILGFLYGLAMADAFIRSGFAVASPCPHALV